jgi:hypothetical protein
LKQARPQGHRAAGECAVARRHSEEHLRRSNPFFVSPTCKMDCFASLAMTALLFED